MTPSRRPSSRPYGSLSREEILDAALALADAEGLEGLSMRTLARALGSAPMSLYRHFDSRASLEQALVDRVIGSSDLGDPDGPSPRAFVREAFLTIRTTLLSHPGVLPLLGMRSSLGKEGLEGLATILGAIEAAGLPPERAVRAVHVLMSYTLGATVTEARMLDPDGDGSAAAPVGLHAVDIAAHPILVERADLLMQQMTDEGFAGGLDALLQCLIPE